MKNLNNQIVKVVMKQKYYIQIVIIIYNITIMSFFFDDKMRLKFNN